MEEEYRLDPDFQAAILQNAIKKAIRRMKEQKRDVDREQAFVLVQVAHRLAEIISDAKSEQIRLHPTFRSGGVEIQTHGFFLDGDQVQLLSEVFEQCGVVSLDTRTSSTIALSVTVEGVFTGD